MDWEMGFIEVAGKRYTTAELEAMPMGEFRKLTEAWEAEQSKEQERMALEGSAVPSGIFMGAMSLPGFGVPEAVDPLGLVQSAPQDFSSYRTHTYAVGGISEELKKHVRRTTEHGGPCVLHTHAHALDCNDRCHVVEPD